MDTESIVKRYVEIWNELDPVARRRTIEDLWVPAGRHFMGAFAVEGYDELEKRVTASNARNVVEGGCRFDPAGSLAELPGLIKFRWRMSERDGTIASVGVGILVIDGDRRISRDYLFAETS